VPEPLVAMGGIHPARVGNEDVWRNRRHARETVTGQFADVGTFGAPDALAARRSTCALPASRAGPSGTAGTLAPVRSNPSRERAHARTAAACDRRSTSAGPREETLEDGLAWHPYRACNRYRYLPDVEHNTAVWVLVWVFVAASVAAIVYAAVLMPPS
jgi:hypothetical protein